MTIRHQGEIVDPDKTIWKPKGFRFASLRDLPSTPHSIGLEPNFTNPVLDTVAFFYSPVLGSEEPQYREVKGPAIKEDPLCKQNEITWTRTIERR